MDLEDAEIELLKRKKAETRRNCDLANYITSYAQENKMSLKEIMDCIEIVKEAFYTDGIISF